MHQTKKQSLVESGLNVLSGMILAFIISQLAHIFAPFIQLHIWKGFVWDVSPVSNIFMIIVLTFVSVSRSYAWRRFFNNRHKLKFTWEALEMEEVDNKVWLFRQSLHSDNTLLNKNLKRKSNEIR